LAHYAPLRPSQVNFVQFQLFLKIHFRQVSLEQERTKIGEGMDVVPQADVPVDKFYAGGDVWVGIACDKGGK
jgi:hypothetical protein